MRQGFEMALQGFDLAEMCRLEQSLRLGGLYDDVEVRGPVGYLVQDGVGKDDGLGLLEVANPVLVRLELQRADDACCGYERGGGQHRVGTPQDEASQGGHATREKVRPSDTAESAARSRFEEREPGGNHKFGKEEGRHHAVGRKETEVFHRRHVGGQVQPHEARCRRH